MISRIKKFIDSTHFTNALKVTIAAVFPALLFAYLGNFQIGFTIALGAIFAYPSDIPSNLKHKINGILVAVSIFSVVNLLINIANPFPWILYPLLTVLIFSISMISVYGQRATMISFSALLAIALAFAHIQTGWMILQYAGLLLLGGLFYLLISLLFYYVRPHRYVELQLADCMKLTGQYLNLRGELWSINSDRKEITKKQLQLQVELNTIHENIRAVLLTNRTVSGSSNQNRKMLLAFISLVEIIELAVSTSFDHNKLHQKFDDHPKLLKTYQNLAFTLSERVRLIGITLENHKINAGTTRLDTDIEKLELAIDEYKSTLGDTISNEGVFMLTTMLHYAEKQVEKIKVLEGAFTSKNTSFDLKGKDNDLEKFVSPQYYPWQTLVDNFSFSSTVFRHSLRLTITLLVGFLLGEVLPFQNTYWIVLTIVVIMRQGYGLTKQRTYHRILGTFLGVIIAFSILNSVTNPQIIGTLAIIAMILGFSFTPTNYKVGATFITVYVIFLYSILTPNIQDVIQYRVLDTLVGALLSYLANSFIWPSWEFLNVPMYLEKSIEANRNYISQIASYYNKKGEVPTTYRLARKQSFIAIGNLMASFQRMVQEPKSKQNQLPHLYKLTVINHTMLSSAASMGTYIQTHKTTPASDSFNFVVDRIVSNLDQAIAVLNEKHLKVDIKMQSEDLNLRFIELKKIKIKETTAASALNDIENTMHKQEAQLVIEQLIWLNNLSENNLKSAEILMKIKKEAQ